MKLVTYRQEHGTQAGLIRGDRVQPLPFESVDAVLAAEAVSELEQLDSPDTGPRLDDVDLAPVLINPSKMICIGHNFAAHIREMGRQLPTYPTLFAKYPSALIGANDRIILPESSQAVDWEVELVVIIGKRLTRAGVDEAHDAIAGYTVFNDVSCRDWQHRTAEWLQGKNFDATSPLGPALVTPDEANIEAGVELNCFVNDTHVQTASTADLVFSPEQAISYVSQAMSLNPGDAIALGTPGGVGAAMTPPRYLQPGDVLTTRVENIGECRNISVASNTNPNAESNPAEP